jgi:transposase
VLAAIDRGTPTEEVAKTFSVSMPTIKHWLRRRRETGDVEPNPIPGRPSVKGTPGSESGCQSTSRRTPT